MRRGGLNREGMNYFLSACESTTVSAVMLITRRTVAEGAFTAPVLLQSAQSLGVEMPIVAAVCALLDGSASVGQVVEALLVA